jgi:hypothetical protein
MSRPDEQCPGKETPKPERTGLEEVRRVIEEYANYLREIIQKLRKRFH